LRSPWATSVTVATKAVIMTKAKMWAIASLGFVLGALLSSEGPIRLHSEDVDEELEESPDSG
jgi:hypothetical protein